MRKVIIVDDEIWAIEGLKTIFDWNELGFEIAETFTSSEKALKYLDNNKADLLIADIKIPNIDGLTMIERIRSYDKDIRIIIISGFMEFGYARRAIINDVDDFLVKPIDADALRETLLRIKPLFSQKDEEDLCDIITLSEKLDLFPSLSSNELCREILDIKKSYLYCFAVMYEKCYDEEFISKCFCCNGEIHYYADSERYRVALFYTDVFIDYNNVIESLKSNIKDEKFGVSCIMKSMQDIKVAVFQAKQAFFSRFIHSKYGVEVFVEKNQESLNSVIQILQSIIMQKDVNTLVEFIEKIFVVETNFCIDELILVGNSILLTVNLIFPAREIETIPQAEDIETRFSDITELCNYLVGRVNNVMLNRYSENAEIGTGKTFIPLVKEYVDIHFQEDIGLQEISDKFGVSKKHLGKLFKMYTGQSFTEYVSHCRINMAVKLLTETRLSVREISDICGYSDYPYFARVFKRITGVSATEIRQERSK